MRNLQPHVRLTHMKEHQLLANHILVEEEKQVKGPIKDNQLGDQVHALTINYLHHAEAVVQHNSKWQD
jgi:acid stress-induced BolA-like protein IbaG/YrbA